MADDQLLLENARSQFKLACWLVQMGENPSYRLEEFELVVQRLMMKCNGLNHGMALRLVNAGCTHEVIREMHVNGLTMEAKRELCLARERLHKRQDPTRCLDALERIVERLRSFLELSLEETLDRVEEDLTFANLERMRPVKEFLPMSSLFQKESFEVMN